MKHFAALYNKIRTAAHSGDKEKAIHQYFEASTDQDKLWGIALLIGRKPKGIVSLKTLRIWCQEFCQIPEWLFEESRAAAGDLSETVHLIIPNPPVTSDISLSTCVHEILSFEKKNLSKKKDFVINYWKLLEVEERLIFIKLISGSLKTSLSIKAMTSSISEYTGVEDLIITHRLQAKWSPNETTFSKLFLKDVEPDKLAKPVPFRISSTMEKNIEELGPPDRWQAEWNWGGIRCQIIKQNNQIFLWSDMNELLNFKFPEFADIALMDIGDFIIEGEIVIYLEGKIRPQMETQKRLSRKSVTRKLLQDYPAAIIAIDLLERNGRNLSHQKLNENRTSLEKLVEQITIDFPYHFIISDEIKFNSWDDLFEKRKEGRGLQTTGILLKPTGNLISNQSHNDKRWIWNHDPFIIETVMIYAHRGQGLEANQYKEFSFAVKDHLNDLVPIAKIPVGFSDQESSEISQFINANTIERFGPVKSIKPELIFKLSFENIFSSKRHKSGVTLKNPQVLKWSKEKSIEDIGTIWELKTVINE